MTADSNSIGKQIVALKNKVKLLNITDKSYHSLLGKIKNLEFKYQKAKHEEWLAQ